MRMDTWTFTLVFVVLGMADGDPDELLKSAIDRNVQWLLTGIRDGSFEGADVGRAVVAIFLAEPTFFSPGHEIGLELKEKIRSTLSEAESRNGDLRGIPSEELAVLVQALQVSCAMLNESRAIWGSVGYEERVDRFPSPAMLALCTSRAGGLLGYNFIWSYKKGILLTDEFEYLPMTMECINSVVCKERASCMHGDIPIRRSDGYSNYPLNLTIADLQEMIQPDDDPKPLISVAAAMQFFLFRNRLRLSDLPSWAADFLLNAQDEDGSWGQSTINSYFVIPVLSNKSFLDIYDKHCPNRRKGMARMFEKW